jgi:hypothetical protein
MAIEIGINDPTDDLVEDVHRRREKENIDDANGYPQLPAPKNGKKQA